MTTANVNIMADQNTDANFRSGGSAFSAQLAAMGLIQTADTGQINWTTVTRSQTADVSAGYEIWRFNDSLQATVPIYIKVEYRCGNGTANRWAIWLTIGFSTDGAGNITGTQKVGPWRTQLSSDGTLYGSTACLFSGANNRIAVAMFPNVAGPTASMFFSIERSKDAAGADTADGVIILIATGGGISSPQGRFSQYLPFAGGVPNSEYRWPAILTNNASSGFGTTLHMGIPIPLAGSMKNPGLGALVYTTGDYASMAEVTLSVYSSNHIYKTLGNNWNSVVGSGFANLTDSGSANSRIAMRWE